MVRRHPGAVRDPQNAFLRLLLRKLAPIILVPFCTFCMLRSDSPAKLPLIFAGLCVGLLIALMMRSMRTTCLAIIVAVSFFVNAELLLEAPTEEAAEQIAVLGPVAKIARQTLNVSIHNPAMPRLEYISVVLPCAYEGEFAVKTARSIWENTERHYLHEIVIVDDGSNPPLKPIFPQSMLEGPTALPLKFLRHERPLGLIKAKKAGGDNATGDVIIFLDCHVKPRKGWELAMLRTMRRAGDHRTVAVPGITSLDPDTWQEVNPGGAARSCYIMWSADFTWLLSSPNNEIPIMSGGLLGISRQWWEETGGYDMEMVAWGGENIDQSLRTWLCGGRIEGAMDAFVAHMWRDAKNEKTKLKYPIPTEEVMRNKARAVHAWFDEFVEKAMTFPEYENFVSKKQSIGDMSKFASLKERLKCKPFITYIEKFKHVYIESGLIPEQVYHIRNIESGLCLERFPRETPPHTVALSPCEASSETQIWHPANRNLQDGGKCCSGIDNWNFLQCLTSSGLGTAVGTSECMIAGANQLQRFRLGDDKTMVWGDKSNGCIGMAPIKQENQNQLEGCATKVIQDLGPGKFRLESPRGCSTIVDRNGEMTLEVQPCDKDDEHQVFFTTSHPEGIIVRAGVGSIPMCLDAASGHDLLLYQCFPVEQNNRNQVFMIHADRLIWEGPSKDLCIDQPHMLKDTNLQAGFMELKSCAAKAGQMLTKKDVDGEGSFLLWDKEIDKCLGIARRGAALETPIKMGPCSPSQRWRVLQEPKSQVQHLSSGFCLDAGDEVRAILYPCHQPVGQRKQRFEVVDQLDGNNAGFSWVRLKKGWDDNGRKRYFDRCLDYKPEPLKSLEVRACDSQAIRFERTFFKTPIEHDLLERAREKHYGELHI